MTHVRTQLRSRFKSVLETALGGDYRVFASRKSAINNVAGLTLVDMVFQNDQTRERETMTSNGMDERIHVASLYIRVQRTAAEEEIDDLLDADEVLIVNAVEGEDWSGLLKDTPELVQVNFSDDGRAGRTLGTIVLRYDLEYRIDKSDPETVIE